MLSGELAAYLGFAAATTFPEREIRSAHSVFLRQALTSQPLSIEVSPLHSGGQLAAVNVSITQEDRHCASGHVVFGPRGADLVRHQSNPPAVVGPESLTPRTGRGDYYLAANSFLVSAAVLPHKGLTMDSAHNDLMAVIITSDVVFHATVNADSWMLYRQESTYAGGGWVFGRGEAFDEAGTLLASFSEEAMLRKPTKTRASAM